MKKKFILGTLSLILIGVLAFGMVGSGAWFTSTAASNQNSLTAGTLSLDVNGQATQTQGFTAMNLKPGDWALTGSATLKNTGSVPGHLWYEIVNISPSNSLTGHLYPQMQQNVAPWTRYGSGPTFAVAQGARVDVADLAPGASLPMVLYVSWPSTSSDNDAQGQSFVFDIVWHLDQVH
jgi:hypothetical protein